MFLPGGVSPEFDLMVWSALMNQVPISLRPSYAVSGTSVSYSLRPCPVLSEPYGSECVPAYAASGTERVRTVLPARYGNRVLERVLLSYPRGPLRLQTVPAAGTNPLTLPSKRY
eukprot:3647902-Rhodomonas_salina.3